MRQRARALVFAIAVVLVAAVHGTAVGAERIDLTFLHVNDVYEISPKQGHGGLAPLMTLLERERARAAHSVTTLGGDLISPSVLSGLTQGAHMIELMNAVGLDVATLGNHEFDFGAEALARRIAESRFVWLATNTAGIDGAPFGGAAATSTRTFDGLTVGFFGLLTPATVQISALGAAATVAPVVETARSAVARLNDDGAEVIVALTHLPLADDRALARAVAGIDVILGGHDHDPMGLYEGGTLILKAGHDAQYLAVATLAIDRENDAQGVRVRPEWHMVSTAGVTPDPRVAALVANHEVRLDAALDVAVGTTKTPLDSRRAAVRTGESSIGNLIADALRAGLDADVALVNGGGIRGDRTYAPGATLTRKDVLAELPFGNVAVVIEVTGADLRAVLEHGVRRAPEPTGAFPQVSGLRFVYDPGRAPGRRVVSVEVDGKPLDEAGTYRLATNDYIQRGGDGYASLTSSRRVVDAASGPLVSSLVIDFIAARGEVAPAVEGRIAATAAE